MPTETRRDPDTTVPTLSAAGSDLVGQVFAEKYHVDALLGKGGMGAVYRAHHAYLKHPVAIKLLRIDVNDGDPGYKRFLREAQILSRLDHRNAIRLHDFGFVGSTPYLIMEFVQGKTLRELIAERGHLSATECAKILRSVCSALAEAHGKGIIHRDIKPDNVMIVESDTPGEQGVVKLLDFGISKVLAPDQIDLGETELTHTNMLMGTPRYIAPEQALGKSVDQRTDVYSLAVMAYEMLNGQPPFRGTSGPILIAQHLQESPAPFEQKRKIKASIREVIFKALAKQPDDRQRTIQEFLDEFSDAVTGEKPQPRKHRSRRVLVSTAFLLVTSTIVWLLTSGILESPDGVAPTQLTSDSSPPATGQDASRKLPSPVVESGLLDSEDDSRETTISDGSPETQQRGAKDIQVATATPRLRDEPPEGRPASLSTKPDPGLYVELEHMETLDEAEDLVSRLKTLGIEAIIQSSHSSDRVFFVLVGPYASIPQASSAGAQIRQSLPEIPGNVSRIRTVY